MFKLFSTSFHEEERKKKQISSLSRGSAVWVVDDHRRRFLFLLLRTFLHSTTTSSSLAHGVFISTHAAWQLLETGSGLTVGVLHEDDEEGERDEEDEGSEMLVSECKRKDQIDITHSTRVNMGGYEYDEYSKSLHGIH
jgi:hypothetical protein